MKKTLILILVSLLLIDVSAQKDREIPLKEYFADAEFFFIQEYYLDALSDYLEVYKRGYENNANINYHIGICYLNIPGQKDRSILYLEKAALNASEKYRESTLNEVYAPLDVYLYLGNAYRIQNQLDTAIGRYNEYLEFLDDKMESERGFVNKQIAACNLAKKYIEEPVKVEFENMGKHINTNKANYNPIISGDGQSMVYMSTMPFYEAVFYSQRRGNNWGRPVNITPQLMSDGDQIATGLSYDGTKLLLSRGDAFDSDILFSELNGDGEWKSAKPFKEINTKYWESQASFSADGKTIFFASNRKDGLGEMDIYRIDQDDKGNWGVASNLGEPINTSLNEDAPYLSADGTKLFFSSQGHKTMGGYDLFYAVLSDTGWGEVTNLKYPISTTDEDLFFYPINNGDEGCVYRIEEDGYGSYDIYTLHYLTEEEIEAAIAEQISEEVEEEEEVAVVPSIEPLVIELNPIFFRFDKTTYPDEVNEQLDVVIDILKNNSTASVVIIGHTDAMGPESYNLELSKKRAREVMRYLVKAGIPAEKIETIGMGEKHFVAKNTNADGSDNSEGRKLNRRVELELKGLDSKNFIIKKVDFVPEKLKYESK